MDDLELRGVKSKLKVFINEYNGDIILCRHAPNIGEDNLTITRAEWEFLIKLNLNE